MSAFADTGAVEFGAFRRACGFCSLRELCWPMGLDLSDLEKLQSMVRRSGLLEPGSHLYRVGDAFTAIYAVRTGCIKSFTIEAGGQERVHGFHFRGELLGFDAVHPDRHRCNAVMLESGSVCVIPYQDIARLSIEFHSLHSQVVRLMSREFSRQLVSGAGSGALQKIAAFFLDIDTRLNPAQSPIHDFRLPMPREDISNYLEITPETLSRLIGKLQKKGLIEVNRRHVRLVEPDRLELIARGLD